MVQIITNLLVNGHFMRCYELCLASMRRGFLLEKKIQEPLRGTLALYSAIGGSDCNGETCG